MRSPSDADLALGWLVRTRRGWFAIQVLLMLLAEANTDLHLHSFGLLVLLGAMAALDAAEALWLRRVRRDGARNVGRRAVAVHAAVDLAALTAILALSGGPHNPLASAYLIYIALLAVVLPPQAAWAAAATATALEAVVVLSPTRYGVELHADHLVGHVATFALAAGAITWVVSRLSAALREAQRQRAATDRLAALGTLAAGIAHELGTPLATAQLLAEEAARASADEAVTEPLGALLAQVDRCRSMLDRLRGRGAGDGGADCAPDIDAWVAEWRRAVPDVRVELDIDIDIDIDIMRGPAEPPGPRVAGAADGWRGALWVTLDNARRAGARNLWVEVVCDPAVVTVQVRDDGAGIAPDDAERSTEPFRSGWGGTGLGLFVARSFAESVGGAVALAPAPGGGALATLRMPRVQQ